MPITFRYDAASVVPPSNTTQRKYGQALVLQQQKYKQDDAMRMRDLIYDNQKQRNQQYFANVMRNQDRDFQLGMQQDAQDFAERQQAERLMAQQDRDALNDARFAERQQQLDDRNAQKQRDIDSKKAEQQLRGELYDAIDKNMYSPEDAIAIRKNLMAQSELMGDGYDDAQRAEKLPQLRKQLSELRDRLIDRPSQRAANAPPSFEDWVQANPKEAQKEFASKMAELRDRALLPGGKSYENDDELRQAALEELQSNHAALFGPRPAPPVAQQSPPTATTGQPEAQPATQASQPQNAEPQVLSETERLKRDVAAASQPPVEESPAAPYINLPSPGQPAQTAVPQSPTENLPGFESQPVMGSQIGDAMKVLETGTPEEKLAVRQGIVGKNMADLVNQALAGNEDAAKQLDALEKSMAKEDEYRMSVQRLRSVDASAKLKHLQDLQTQIGSGQLRPQEVIGRIAEAQQVTPSQLYESLMKNPPSRSASPGRRITEKMSALRSLLDEMGEPQSALFSAPNEDDVIQKVAEMGKMSVKDAKEYVYKEILAKQYTDDVIQRLKKDLPTIAKQQQISQKRKNWTPNKDY